MRNAFNLVLCLCLILSASKVLVAQQFYNETTEFLNGNRSWIYGYSQGLSFNANNQPFAIQHPNVFGAVGVATVSDRQTGELLFYTDGSRVWDADHQIMPNGLALYGQNAHYLHDYDYSGAGEIHGALILPVIGNDDQYYIFYLNGGFVFAAAFSPPVPVSVGNPVFDGYYLFYSVVDMSLNNGKGDVIANKKNIPLGPKDTRYFASFIAVPGENCDVWLLFHHLLAHEFWAYNISENGIDTVPVISTIPIQGQHSYGIGKLAVSPNRQYIAMAHFAPTFVPGVSYGGPDSNFVARFNPSTGEVFDPIFLNQKAASVCFSPNNSKLYLGGGQFDLSTYTATAINSSWLSFWPPHATGAYRSYGGKIYMQRAPFWSANGWTNYQGPPYCWLGCLSIIEQPNLVYPLCNFNIDAIPFLPNTATNLTNGPGNTGEVVYAYYPDTISNIALDTFFCSDNTGELPIPLPVSPSFMANKYFWSDGTIGNVNTINKPGIYWVHNNSSCHFKIDSFIVRSEDLSMELPKDTVICDGRPFRLHLPIPDAQYKWQDGSSDNTMNINATGRYWVEIVKNGCSVSDTLDVTFFGPENEINDSSFCHEASIDIDYEINLAPGASIIWSSGENTPKIHIIDTGLYWVRVSHPLCTSFTDSFRIAKEICDCVIQIPNAFSPNGDGVNDIFLPVIELDCPVTHFNLNIYSRYGQRVFNSVNPTVGWDGTFRGRLADIGTYFFDVSFIGGTKGKRVYKKGDITLLR